MTFEKQNHPDQMSLEPILERAATNKERQKKWREKQKQLGRKAATFTVTEEEKFYLERMLLDLRKGLKPAMMRDSKGRMKPCDI